MNGSVINDFHDLFERLVILYKQNTVRLFDENVESSIFVEKSLDTFLENVSKICFYAHKTLKLQKGDKIAIMAKTSTLWLEVDFACMLLGLISVPIFHNISKENFEYQIDHSDSKILFCESEMPFKTEVKKIFIDHNNFYKEISLVDSLDAIHFVSNLKKPNQDDMCTIVYTSGTSGTPKGVMISHKNICTQIVSASKRFPMGRGFRAISFLPSAHIFQRMICYFYLYSLIDVYFVFDHHRLAYYIKTINPHCITVVPRVLEKIVLGVKEKIKEQKGLSGSIARYALDVALSKLLSGGVFQGILSKIVYKKILSLFGDSIVYVVSGGARLGDEFYRFFTNIGLPIYQGYGLTEMSPVIGSNCPKDSKIYTVGKVFDGVEVKTLEDGELLAKGPNVMLGYYKDEINTKKVIDEDGFFKTGDLASINPDGFIKITGRKKENFKTSTGKYIDPIKMESMINQNKIIEASCVIADGKSFVSVIIFINKAFCDKMSENEIEKAISAYIVELNLHLDKHEQIVKYYISKTHASPETGELTPSMKVRRSVIESKFSDVISSFYL